MVNVNTFVLTMMDHMNVHATLDMRLEMTASPVKVSKNVKIIILYNNHSIPSPSSHSPSPSYDRSMTLSLSLPSHSPSYSCYALPLPPFMLSLSLPSSFHYCHPPKHLFLLFRCKRMCFGEWRM